MSKVWLVTGSASGLHGVDNPSITPPYGFPLSPGGERELAIASSPAKTR